MCVCFLFSSIYESKSKILFLTHLRAIKLGQIGRGNIFNKRKVHYEPFLMLIMFSTRDTFKQSSAAIPKGAGGKFQYMKRVEQVTSVLQTT